MRPAVRCCSFPNADNKEAGTVIVDRPASFAKRSKGPPGYRRSLYLSSRDSTLLPAAPYDSVPKSLEQISGPVAQFSSGFIMGEFIIAH